MDNTIPITPEQATRKRRILTGADITSRRTTGGLSGIPPAAAPVAPVAPTVAPPVAPAAAASADDVAKAMADAAKLGVGSVPPPAMSVDDAMKAYASMGPPPAAASVAQMPPVQVRPTPQMRNKPDLASIDVRNGMADRRSYKAANSVTVDRFADGPNTAPLNKPAGSPLGDFAPVNNSASVRKGLNISGGGAAVPPAATASKAGSVAKGLGKGLGVVGALDSLATGVHDQFNPTVIESTRKDYGLGNGTLGNMGARAITALNSAADLPEEAFGRLGTGLGYAAGAAVTPGASVLDAFTDGITQDYTTLADDSRRGGQAFSPIGIGINALVGGDTPELPPAVQSAMAQIAGNEPAKAATNAAPATPAAPATQNAGGGIRALKPNQLVVNNSGYDMDKLEAVGNGIYREKGTTNSFVGRGAPSDKAPVNPYPMPVEKPKAVAAPVSEANAINKRFDAAMAQLNEQAADMKMGPRDLAAAQQGLMQMRETALASDVANRKLPSQRGEGGGGIGGTGVTKAAAGEDATMSLKDQLDLAKFMAGENKDSAEWQYKGRQAVSDRIDAMANGNTAEAARLKNMAAALPTGYMSAVHGGTPAVQDAFSEQLKHLADIRDNRNEATDSVLGTGVAALTGGTLGTLAPKLGAGIGGLADLALMGVTRGKAGKNFPMTKLLGNRAASGAVGATLGGLGAIGLADRSPKSEGLDLPLYDAEKDRLDKGVQDINWQGAIDNPIGMIQHRLGSPNMYRTQGGQYIPMTAAQIAAAEQFYRNLPR